MTADNMIEIPKELFWRLLAALETPDDISSDELQDLIDDTVQWVPPGTDEEIERSFDANR